jgi:hypothetical protein
MRRMLIGLLAIGLAGAMVMACGSGDDNNSSPPGTTPDASSLDGTTPPGTDSGKPPGNDGSTPDAGCNFATFVKGLVANDTTMTALPSTNLGQGCTDDQNQAEFQSLFP